MSGVGGYIFAFVAHTFAIYLCAMHLSPWLVGVCFRLEMHLFHIVPSTTVGNWYLQHLIGITICPAVVIGFLAARFVSHAASPWACSVPLVVLTYKMLTFHAPSSVLTGSLISPFRYYFEIQPVMPNLTNFLTIDVARVLAQMTVTAPFCAGVVYSLGTSVAKRAKISAGGPDLTGI